MATTELASAQSARGQIVLRRRDDGALELRVNGVFVMDTAEGTTEAALADHVVSHLDAAQASSRHSANRVLVGGLGLGTTLRRLADSPNVDEIVVVEIEGALLDWHRDGLVPGTADLWADGRITFLEGDVSGAVASAGSRSLDALILDVDNGPGFLVYDGNAALYQPAFLMTCRTALVAGGALLVWSADAAPELEAALTRIFASVTHQVSAVTLGTRAEHYHTYVAVKGVAVKDVAVKDVPAKEVAVKDVAVEDVPAKSYEASPPCRVR